jgi:hypothetical protein
MNFLKRLPLQTDAAPAQNRTTPMKKNGFRIRSAPLGIFAAAFVVLGLLFLIFAIYTPPIPDSWKEIQIGETRERVLQRGVVEPDHFIPMKYLDQAVLCSQHPIYGRVWQLLQITYTEDMVVKSVTTECETERFRLWRRRKLRQ